MGTASNSLQGIMTGTPEQRVEALQQFLGYPLKQRDPEKDLFWYLRPGTDEEAASETRPVAVGFYPELNEESDSEIKAWIATNGSEVSQHFFDWGDFTNQPVMYLLLPEAQQVGRVALVLPSESRQWRQRQVLTYAWNNQALLTPLGRLQQGELELMQKVKDKPMFSVPLVEWAFYKPIETAKELAQELARVSRKMEQAIPAVYAAEGADGYLKTLYESFKRELLPTLKVSADNAKDYSFADIYAQTIAYGLFTARVFSHVRNPREDFNREDAWDKLPETNPFLRQLFHGISEQPVEALGDDLADKISEVFSILRVAKMDAILSDFRQKMNREDIVIRFYEDFLAAYKPEMRERRGVYYTPEPVVSYMVRSVDILLKEKFDKPLGLADPEVMILDPACGTGTFLLWIFQLIHQRFEENPEALTEGLEDSSWSGYVQQRLLPRVFGFELLMAPYAICHLKLGLFLEETGYQFDSGKRLGVYLTNTLDEAVQKSESLFEEFVAEESDQAALIKRDKPIMAVIGNPPYSGLSENKDKWITSMIQEDYYPKDEIKERKLSWLLDDYVKFICFGQWRISKSDKGILAFVTNHGFLDNPTFRKMRKELKETFEEIFVLDLHGNINKREVSPDGTKDENVFDIRQGVSINLFCRLSKEIKLVKHMHLYGSRKSKNNWLIKHSIKESEWNEIRSGSMFNLFIPQDESFLEEYSKGYKLDKIMPVNSTGIITSRDSFSIQWVKSKALEIVQDFASLDVKEARKKYSLGKDGRDWKVSLAQSDIKQSELSINQIKKILYRPFDTRFTYYTGNSRGFHSYPRGDVMRHMIAGNNIGLIYMRQVAIQENYSHFMVSNSIVDNRAFYSNKGTMQLSPLYLFDTSPSSISSSSSSYNFSPGFVRDFSRRIGFIPKGERVFYYIYAIFYSPTYRIRYAEFLKIDFPRIPLTSSSQLFQILATYGETLVNLHLMKSPTLESLITQFEDGDRTVDPGHPKYTNGKVTINKRGTGFTGVPEEVWNFYIGGYQVCHKWLKDRKGRTLSDDDILHYQKIIVALQETIRIMQQIDDAIPSWPIE